MFCQILKRNKHVHMYIQDLFTTTVVGTVVLTAYNNNTYRIDDVDFDATPNSTFKTKDDKVQTYTQYYKNKYDIKISNLKQPLLLTRSRARDRQAIEQESIYLVPELCRATGTLYNIVQLFYWQFFPNLSLFFPRYFFIVYCV